MAMPAHELPDDGNRYEVIDGKLFVTPAPSELHQDAVGELYLRLRAYADPLHLHVFFAHTAVTFSARREVQSDLLVLPSRDGQRVRVFRDVRKLALAVEVLSPSTVRTDRYIKRRLFASEGVPKNWIVDTAMRLIERWRPGRRRTGGAARRPRLAAGGRRGTAGDRSSGVLQRGSRRREAVVIGDRQPPGRVMSEGAEPPPLRPFVPHQPAASASST